MATSPFGNFADLSSARRLVDAGGVAPLNPLEELISGFTQGQALRNLPQTLDAQRQAQLEGELTRRLNNAILSQKLQDLQNPQAALAREVQKSLALKEADLASSLGSMPGLSLDASGKLTAGTTPAGAAGEGSPEAALATPVTILPNGRVYDPLAELQTKQTILDAQNRRSIEAKQAQIKSLGKGGGGYLDPDTGEWVQVAPPSVTAPASKFSHVGNDSTTGRPILLDATTGKTILGELPDGSKFAPKPGVGISTALVTPEALQGVLDIFDAGGMPNFSRNPALQVAFYEELGKRKLGGDSSSQENLGNKAIRKGMEIAYKTQQNMLAGEEVSIKALHKQFERAKGLLVSGGDPTGMPLLNRPAIWLKRNVEGSPDTAAYDNMTTTMANEFAKIMSGSTASIAGSTVSSVEDAKHLLDSAQTKEQFEKIVETMEFEANTRLAARKEELEKLRDQLMHVGRKEKTETSASAPPLIENQKQFDALPSGSQYREADGKLYQKP